MLKEVRKTRVAMDQNAAPLLVHCSAGVGRTGTFIVIDQVITALEQGQPGSVDIVDLIGTIREDRMALVQHTIQYKFAYQACCLFAQTEGIEVFVSGATQDGAQNEQQEKEEQQVGLLAAEAVEVCNFKRAQVEDLKKQANKLQRNKETHVKQADGVLERLREKASILKTTAGLHREDVQRVESQLSTMQVEIDKLFEAFRREQKTQRLQEETVKAAGGEAPGGTVPIAAAVHQPVEVCDFNMPGCDVPMSCCCKPVNLVMTSGATSYNVLLF